MLKSLEIRQFRNINEARLTFSEGLNLVAGRNASGKTSLLEATYYLFRGRSFRTAHWRQVAMEGQKGLSVRAEVEGHYRLHTLSSKRSKEGQDYRRDGDAVTRTSEILAFKPCLYLGPQIGDLVSGKPEVRRRWLDFTVFHVKHESRTLWRRYSRALNQRNAAIRSGANAAVLDVVDTQLSKIGEALTAMRSALLDQTVSSVPTDLLKLFDLDDMDVSLKVGWDQETDLFNALTNSRETDARLGFTHIGPHRADVMIRQKNRQSKSRLSRGQEKMVGLLLLLSQIEVLKTQSELAPLLLLDDLSAELDDNMLGGIIDWVSQSKSQCLATSLPNSINAWKAHAAKMFHVEQGQVTELI